MFKPPDSCNVATPPDLANAMAEAIGLSSVKTWLEPCVGDGIFLEVLKQNGVPRNQIRAIDIDARSRPNDRFARTLRGRDFLKWGQETPERFDRIVANPPYIGLSQVAPETVAAAKLTNNLAGIPIGKRSNVWHAFMCRLVRLLSRGGNIAVVLPAAWDFADYAADLRLHLPSKFRRFGVFRASKPLFETVLDGSIVVLGIGFEQPHKGSVRREYSTRSGLVRAVKDFRNSRVKLNSRKIVSANKKRTMADFAEIRLGGVTGQADYFLMTENERRVRRLPLSAMRPVLTRSNHLSSPVVTDIEWNHLLEESERIWMFNPPEKALKRTSVQSYLDLAKANGGCDRARYKIKRREPWYRTPLAERVDGFISGMSNIGPWICFNEMENLNASNTLYTIKFCESLSRRQKFALGIFLITTRCRRQIERSSRIYAQGLKKIEPGDLSRIHIPTFTPPTRPVTTYRKCVSLLLSGNVDEASKLANSAFGW